MLNCHENNLKYQLPYIWPAGTAPGPGMPQGPGITIGPQGAGITLDLSSMDLAGLFGGQGGAAAAPGAQGEAVVAVPGLPCEEVIHSDNSSSTATMRVTFKGAAVDSWASTATLK
jgi:hypothetical protein